MADVYALADAQRGDILSLDRTAATRMVTAYAEIYQDTLRRLDSLQAQIASSGGTPTRHALFQEARYQDLVTQLQAGMTLFSRVAEGATQDAIRQALAAFDQEALHAASFGKAPIEIGSQGFATVPWEALNSMISFTATGTPLRDLFTAASSQGLDDAVKSLTSGILRGLPARVVASNLRTALGITPLRAMTIARTELLRAYREAQRLSILANPDVYEGWVWRAALNARTCAVCWTMHGTLYPVTDGKLTHSMPGSIGVANGILPPGLTVAPMETHPNCRCVLSPRPKSYAEILNDPTIPDRRLPMESGSSLFSKLPFDRQRSILGPGRHDLYLSGMPLAEMLTRVGNKTWGPMVRMQPLRTLAPKLGLGENLTGLDMLPGKRIEVLTASGIQAFQIHHSVPYGYQLQIWDPTKGIWKSLVMQRTQSLLSAQIALKAHLATLRAPGPRPGPPPPPPGAMSVKELAAARKAQGVTSTALAKEMGISTTYLAKLEASGKMRPDLEAKYRAALAKLTNGKLGGAEPGGSGGSSGGVPEKGALTAAQVTQLFGKLTNAELAKMLGVSTTRVYRMRKEGVSAPIADRLRSVLGTKGGGSIVAPPPKPTPAPKPTKATTSTADKDAAQLAALRTKVATLKDDYDRLLTAYRTVNSAWYRNLATLADEDAALALANAARRKMLAAERALKKKLAKVQDSLPIEQRVQYGRPTQATHGTNWEVAARIYDDSLAIIRALEKIYPSLRSRWTGQIQIEAGRGNFAAYFSWSNFLGITTRTIAYSTADLRKVLIHEYLHSLSPKLLAKDFQTRNGLGFEEGVVERMTQLLEARIWSMIGWGSSPRTYQTYAHYTTPLVNFGGALGLDQNAYFDELFATPYPKREQFLIDQAKLAAARIKAGETWTTYQVSPYYNPRTAYGSDEAKFMSTTTSNSPVTIKQIEEALAQARSRLRYTQDGTITPWATRALTAERLIL